MDLDSRQVNGNVKVLGRGFPIELLHRLRSTNLYLYLLLCCPCDYGL